MRFPSAAALARRAWAVALRFPWTLAAAALAAFAACMAAGASGAREDDWGRLAMTTMLAVPLTAAVTLAGERRGWPRLAGFLGQLAGLGLIALFHVTWPGPREQWEVLRYVQLSAALHLLVAVLPFIRGPETPAFWDYNRRLLLAFLRAAVFSAVLFIGLAIALGALDKLFGVNVSPRVYARLWVIIALLGNTWIFLAALGDDVTRSDERLVYPRALKVFTQYILTPLVAVYLVILTAYLAKIVVTREWPSGWIGWLVGSVSVSGILGFLLVHPLRQERDEGWIAIYARWLFLGLIPAAVMLLLALGKRIAPYGLTELRVIALALGVWLLTVAAVYTLRPASGIRLIPLSLAALLVVLMAGPFSATRLGVRSQSHRLDRMLAAVSPATGVAGVAAMSADTRREIGAATRYLVERNARGPLEHTFHTRLAAELTGPRQSPDSAAARLLATRSIAYAPELYRARHYRSVERPRATPVGTTGYDWLFEMESGDTGTIALAGDSLHYASDSARTTFTLTGRADTLRFDLAPAARAVSDTAATAPAWNDSTFVVPAAGARFRGLLALRSVYRADAGGIAGWSGQLLLAPR